MAPKKTTWLHSLGRELLMEDIRSKRIHGSMDWEEVFEYRPEFAVGVNHEEAKRLFKGRLASAHRIINKRNARAATEMALLRADRATHPAPLVNRRGEPSWEGSAAQKLLKKDVADKKHETKNRHQFYSSRSEYQVYPKRIITAKVEQEVRLIKFRNQRAHDQKKKKEKKRARA